MPSVLRLAAEAPPPPRSEGARTARRRLGNRVRAPRGPEASGKRSQSGARLLLRRLSGPRVHTGSVRLEPSLWERRVRAWGLRYPTLRALQTPSLYYVPFDTAAVLRRPDPAPQRDPGERRNWARRRDCTRARPRGGGGFYSYPAARYVTVRAEGAWCGPRAFRPPCFVGLWAEQCCVPTGRDREGRRLLRLRFLPEEAAGSPSRTPASPWRSDRFSVGKGAPSLAVKLVPTVTAW